MGSVCTLCETHVPMDVLLELSPGTGWLARERDRIVYLPNPESVDVAHDVIEPLLVAPSAKEAFALLTRWIRDERALPTLAMIGIAPEPRVLAHGIDSVELVSADGQRSSLDLGSGGTTSIGDARAVSLHDEDELASGMLVEGVVRAGGFRLNLRRPPIAGARRDVDDDTVEEELRPAGPRLRIDEDVVEVGDGLVLGRWPYEGAVGLEPLVIADPAVSRRHAEVRLRDGSLVVIDRSSHNGTLVVAARTGRQFRLEPDVAFEVSEGDQVLVGDTIITVV